MDEALQVSVHVLLPVILQDLLIIELLAIRLLILNYSLLIIT